MSIRSFEEKNDGGSDHAGGRKEDTGGGWGRREFVTAVLGTLAATSLLTARWAGVGSIGTGSLRGAGLGWLDGPGIAGVGREKDVMEDLGAGVAEVLTVRQVIARILLDIPGAPFAGTVDTIKAGDMDQPVKGIVTTMFATDAVIAKTIQLGANFIIAHEPTFYSHTDATDWLAEDKVFRFKKELLDKHGIVVWRFHDYWHSARPDGILMGVLTALGWDKFYNAGEPPIITVPAISLGDVVKRVKKGLEIEKVKVIGNLSQSCQRIVLSPGAAGGRSQIAELQKYQPDLLIVGDLNEWETSEYVRDARYQGEEVSLIVLGHSVSEEPGMQWLLPWLQPKVPGVTITHVPSGDAFNWV